MAKSIYGAGRDLGEQWARERHDELDTGVIDAVLDALRVHSPKDDEARKCIDYVERNRARTSLSVGPDDGLTAAGPYAGYSVPRGIPP